jgi:probable HAF family extracellular repeat protein
MGKLFKAVGILTLLLTVAAPAKAVVQYTVEPLGDFSPIAINASGDVIGNLSKSTYSTGVLYHNGEIIELGTLGGSYSYATSINDIGQIVGHSITSDGKSHAFLYSGGEMADLGNLGKIKGVGSLCY